MAIFDGSTRRIVFHTASETWQKPFEQVLLERVDLNTELIEALTKDVQQLKAKLSEEVHDDSGYC